MITVDWRVVINELHRAGLTYTQQAREISVCKRTIVNWREGYSEPPFSLGAKLLDIYQTVVRST